MSTTWGKLFQTNYIFKKRINMAIILKELTQTEAQMFWELAFSDINAEWTKWNGPYFHDKLPKKKEFLQNNIPNSYLNNPLKKVIWLDGKMVGMVSAYFEDGKLEKWLDVGICIYKQTNWHKNIGYQALTLWITELFEKTNLPHIGLTTWSGNYRMLGLAEKLALKKEAQIRKVRYWQGQYFDSVKYGVLREEWQKDNV